jgi:CHAT domain-containing protein
MLIRDQVKIFDGLLANRDDSDAPASVRLYEELLHEAVEDLPDGIRRLVIIPDGALHRLPFGALRNAPEGSLLASRFDISIVPSATVWRGIRKRGEVDLQQLRVLALADPDLSECTGIDNLRNADPWIEGLRIGRLPHAVEEARAMVRAVRGGSRLLTDVEASEHNVKNLELDSYGILHFASPAVVDDEKPERSAILLAAGGGADDGLLQIREIVELDLAGKVVILTGCRTSSGAVMEGEGVIGLARAFFQAGATTVIGGLWPLRDDDTALLMEEFSRQIGKGKSVGTAMSEAKRSRIAAGSPAASWAGLVVLGEADVVPVPGGRRGWLPAIALGAAVLVVVMLAWVRARMRGH